MRVLAAGSASSTVAALTSAGSAYLLLAVAVAASEKPFIVSLARRHSSECAA
jgi:hypothetical protein